MMERMDLGEARALFSLEPGWLNTAHYGVPPDPAWDAMQAALSDWRSARTSAQPWYAAVAEARETFARLSGVSASDVSIGAQVSQLLGPLAASLPSGSTVLVPNEDFTSLLFPWLAQEQRNVTTRFAPLARLAEAVTAETDVVAFSLVQSATGEVADVDAIVAAAASVGARTVVDVTQAFGWLPVDAARFDAIVCSGYKWLMSPRGTAFLITSAAYREQIVPSQAGWFAGDDPATSYYGPPLRLAADARRLDISPAWFSWIGTAPALELIEKVGVAQIGAHNVSLANRFRAGLGLPPADSAIVSVDIPDAERRLAAAGIRASVRDGRLRASFHLYTTTDDVDRAVAALVSRR